MIPQEHKTELTEILEKRGIYFTPTIKISINDFEKISLLDFELNNREGVYEKVRQAIKPVVNYTWDNNILRVTNIFGDEFCIQIYLAKKNGNASNWEITLWDYHGTTTIGVWYKKYSGDGDKLSFDEIRDIKERLDEFTHNILHCSDCQSTMPSDNNMKKTDLHQKEYGGQYFAGHYCKDCWERNGEQSKPKKIIIKNHNGKVNCRTEGGI